MKHQATTTKCRRRTARRATIDHPVHRQTIRPSSTTDRQTMRRTIAAGPKRAGGPRTRTGGKVLRNKRRDDVARNACRSSRSSPSPAAATTTTTTTGTDAVAATDAVDGTDAAPARPRTRRDGGHGDGGHRGDRRDTERPTRPSRGRHAEQPRSPGDHHVTDEGEPGPGRHARLRHRLRHAPTRGRLPGQLRDQRLRPAVRGLRHACSPSTPRARPSRCSSRPSRPTTTTPSGR